MFDRYPHRRAMALACRDRTVGWSDLGEASGQSEGNGRKSGEALRDWGVLGDGKVGAGKSGLRLRDEWRKPLEEAELRATKGRVIPGAMLLLIARPIEPFYRLIANRAQPDPRIAWVARLPHHAKFGLIALLNPTLDEDQVERLTGELDDAGVTHERLTLGKLAGHPELREFAAGSLPGSFGPGQ